MRTVKLSPQYEETSGSLLRKSLFADHPRLRERLAALALIADGVSAKAVARRLGRHRGTVESWVRCFNRHGLNGLKPTFQGQPGAILSPDELAQLQQIITQPPRQAGLKTGIWTGKVVRKIMRLSAVIIYTLVSLMLLTASFTRADAHLSWCHHWHACPSDHSTPYTCGDRGYCRQCPDNAYCQAGRRRSAAPPPPPAMTPGMGRPSRHGAVCEGEAPNGAGSNTVTLPTPKGGSTGNTKQTY